jgi:hypothetical protein
LETFTFARLCNASPKDFTRDGCFYDNFDDLKTALINSQRTFYMLTSKTHDIHLMLRKKVYIQYECRCFFNNGLKAVSCNCHMESNEKEYLEDLVRDFFEMYESDIPYYSCCVDVAVNIDDVDVFVVEINEYSKRAGAELFSWEEDAYILNSTDKIEPEFRYKNIYSF